MVGEIGAALTSLKTAFDLAKGISEIAKSADIQGAVIGLQHQILQAQESALSARDRESTLLQQIADLKSELATFQSWEQEKARYSLEVLPPGISMYGLIPEQANGEPDHKLCAICFHKGIKTILNSAPYDGQTKWTCRVCNTNEFTGQRNPRTTTIRRSNWLG